MPAGRQLDKDLSIQSELKDRHSQDVTTGGFLRVSKGNVTQDSRAEPEAEDRITRDASFDNPSEKEAAEALLLTSLSAGVCRNISGASLPESQLSRYSSSDALSG